MEKTRLTDSTNGIKNFRFLDHHLEDQRNYEFAIIIATFQNQQVWVRHKERQTWELPAGHVEPGETVLEAAHRELFEETGAIDYQLTPLVSYEGDYQGKMVNGKIFRAEISRFGNLPETEIAENKLFPAIPENLTYPGIQPSMIAYCSNL